MSRVLWIKVVLVFVIWASVAVSERNETPQRPANAETLVAAKTEMPLGCQPHIELHGSEFWARELGLSEGHDGPGSP